MEAVTLLEQWVNGIKIAHVAHLRTATRYHAMNRILGLPVTVFSVLIGTSIFGSLASTKEGWFLIVAGVVSVIAAVLSAIQTFLNYPELATKHQTAGTKYGQLRREIEETLATTDDPIELKSAIPGFRKKWNALCEASPDLPQRFHDQALRFVKPALVAQRDAGGPS